MSVLAGKKKKRKPWNVQFIPRCSQFVFTVDYVTKRLDFQMPGVLLNYFFRPRGVHSPALPCDCLI